MESKSVLNRFLYRCRRGIATLAAAAVFITTDLSSYADLDYGAPSADLYINGSVATGEYNFEYGQEISFFVMENTNKGTHPQVYMYKKGSASHYADVPFDSEADDLEVVSTMQAEEGIYEVGFDATFGEEGLIEVEKEKSGITFVISKATILAPSNVYISDVPSQKVSFNIPATTTKENALLEGAIENYTVRLYHKDAETKDYAYTDYTVAEGEPGTTFNTSEGVTSVTTGKLDEAITKYGWYAVSVIANSSNTEHYLNSGESVLSNVYKIEDTTTPGISDYNKGAGQFLQATLKDSESGVLKYAFSKAETAEAVTESEWIYTTPEQNEASKTAGGTTVSYYPLSSGAYYVYACDADGNHYAKSAESRNSSVITLDNYYKNNLRVTGNDAKVALIGGESYTLPDISGERKGYSFGGWKNSEGTIVTSASSTGTDATFTAVWNAKEIVFEKVSVDGAAIAANTAAEITYKGEPGVEGSKTEIVLSAKTTIDGVSPDAIRYNWVKDGVRVWETSRSEATLTLSHAIDSGVYKAVAEFTDSDGNVLSATDTKEITVKVNKRKLTVTYTGTTEITFDDQAPLLTYDITGFGEGDSAEALVSGELATSYKKGDDAGTYKITKGSLSAADYDILFMDVDLTVNRLPLTEGVNLTVTDPATEYVYTGTAIEPAVTFKYSGNVLASGVDYTVSYTDNTNVGTARATYSFVGNFSGSYEFEFAIVKADREANEVIKAGFTYNGSYTGVAAKLKLGVSEDTIVSYKYYGTLADGSPFASEEHPSNTAPNEAGTYYVFAVLSATGNFTEQTTAKTEFTIAKRPLKFTTPTKSWEFDGSTHSQATYEMEGTLASGDGLQSVVVTGHVLDVQSDVPNDITITFDQTTNEYNYEITKVLGKLSVTQATLPNPSNCAWNADTPGTATWTGIVRTNVEVEYTVNLYMHGDGGDTLLSTVTTTHNSYSFKDTILAKEKGKFYFTVSAHAKSGAYATYYKDSVSSGKSPDIATIDVVVEYDTTNTVSVSVDGKLKHNGDEFRVFQAQTLDIAMVPAEGHSINSWSVIDLGSGLQYSTNCYFKNQIYESTTLTIGSTTTHFDFTKGDSFKLKVVAEDDLPVIEKFEGQNTVDYENVLFYIRATDSKELTGYKLWKDGEAEPAEWTVISTKKFETVDGISGVIYKRGEGTYNFKIKDSYGHVVSAPDPVVVKKIDFDDGIAGTQTVMHTIYAVNETTITLPENKYTNTGKGFKHWSSAHGGDFSDKDSYPVEVDDTLTAVWGDLSLEYTVRHFYMDASGNYSETPDAVKNFKASYNEAIIPSTNESIRVDKVGFSFDASRTSSETTYIKSESESYVFDVYYSRNQYKLIYKFANPSTGMDDYFNEESGKFTETEAYHLVYFGAALPEEPAVPSIAGYNFGAGWTYEGTGERPLIMPAGDVTATVSCSADSASYKINYFYQNLPTTLDGAASASNSFSKGTYKVGSNDVTVVSTDTVFANHGTPITYDAASAPIVKGFTATFVTATKGTEGEMDSVDFSGLTNTASGEVSKEGIEIDGVDQYLNINVYYIRDLYSATLNVSRKGLTSGLDGTDVVKRYKRENIAFGFPFTPQIVSDFENAIFDNNTNTLVNSENGEIKKYYEYLDSVTSSDDSSAEKSRLSALIASEKSDPGLAAYTLANYRDWSTGSTPEYMPAGDLNLNRQYVLASESFFLVDVYLENVNYDSTKAKTDITAYSTGYNSTPDYTLTFHGATGGVAKITGSKDPVAGVSSIVDYTDFNEYIDKFWFYEYKAATQTANNATLTATINDTNLNKDEPTRLSIYFDRKTATTNINYYYYDDTVGNSKKKFATITKTGKWGMPYTADFSAFFHGDSETNTSRYLTDNDRNTCQVKYESGVDKETDFCEEKYVVSYYHVTWTSYNSTATEWNYGENTLTSASQIDVSNIFFFGKNNYYTERTGSSLDKNYVDVYYSLPTHSFFINRDKYDATNLTAFSVAEKADGFTNKKMQYTLSISGLTATEYTDEGGNVVPSGSSLDASGFEFLVREGNKADIVKNEFATATGKYTTADLAKYPGLENLPGNKVYTYTEGTPKTADFYTFTLTQGTEYSITVSVAGHKYVMKVTPKEDITYYAKTIGMNNYIYLPDAANRLYLGYEHNDLSINGNSFCTGSNGSYSREGIYVKNITSTNPVRAVVWAGATNVLADYMDLCDTFEEMYAKDTNAKGAYVVNNGCCDIATDKNYMTSGADYSAYYYYHNPTYSISYVIGSTIHRDSTTHAAGEKVYPSYKKGLNNPANGTVDSMFAVREGYEIHWYKDPAHTEPMPAEVTMPSHDLVYYGQYEKNLLHGYYFQHYELADPLVIGGQEVRYVTEANMAAVAEALGIASFTVDSETETRTYLNEFDVESSVTCDVYTYSHDGVVVLVKHQAPMISFADASLKDSDMYGAENIPVGFYFDMAYPGTTWTGYCQTDPINFDTYYARDRFVLSVNEQEPKNNNIQTKNELYGQHVSLKNLTRKGYTFEGWKVYDTGAGSDLTLDSDGKVVVSGYTLFKESNNAGLNFTMPNTNIYAEAEWTPAEFEYMLMYYFAGEDGNFDSEKADKLEAIASKAFEKTGLVSSVNGTVTDVTVDGAAYKVKSVALKNDNNRANIGFVITDSSDAVVGAYEVIPDYFGEGKALVIYYAPDRVESKTVENFYADAVNAIGASATITLSSEAKIVAGTYALGKTDRSAIEGIFAYSPYKYSFASYTLYESIERKGLSDEIVISPDMELSVYYGRKNDYTITFKDAALDGGDSGLTVSGHGSAAYGEIITIKESHVGGSYNFNGWYEVPEEKEDSLFEGEGTTGKVSSAVLATLTKLGNTQTITYRVKGDTIIYAISDPKGVPTAGVSISANKGQVSGNQYSVEYGTGLSVKSTLAYTDPSDLAISMVKTPEVNWYIATYDGADYGEPVKVSGANGTNLPLDGSLDTGDYKIYCTYTLTRNDNARKVTVTSNEITLKVNPKTPVTSATGYEGQYDGEYHNITVNSVAEGATVYYSVDVPFDTEGSVIKTNEAGAPYAGGKVVDSSFPGIRNVKRADKDSPVESYTVYYYVVDADSANVNPISGSATLKLTPVQLKFMVHASQTFTKTYDGSANITGEDKARLQAASNNSFYEVLGWVEADEAELSSLLLDFDGVTNTRHVAESSFATLSNLIIVVKRPDGSTYFDPNYTFDANGEAISVTIPANVEPLDVKLKWATDTVTYNSEEQTPDISFGVSIPSVNGAPELTTSMIQVTGQQKNVGENYRAYATIRTPEECTAAGISFDAGFDHRDYVIKEADASKIYKIDKCSVVITPPSYTTVYSGKSITLNADTRYPLHDYFELSGYVLKENQYLTAVSDRISASAGTKTYGVSTESVNIYETTDVIIKDEAGNDVHSTLVTNITENFRITSGTGTMEMLKRKISVEGLTVADKEYDETTDATDNTETVAIIDRSTDATEYSGYTLVDPRIIDWKDYVYSHFRASDISANSAMLTYAFESPVIGDNKNVSITYPADLDSILTGNEKNNFTLVEDKCQKLTTASILGKVVSLNINPQVVIYGDAAPVIDKDQYSVTLLGSDTLADASKPELYYKIRKLKDADGVTVADGGWVNYSNTAGNITGAGTYELKAYFDADCTVTHKTVGNYTLSTEKTTTLTVNRKEISISGNIGVSKCYDGSVNALSVISDELIIKSGLYSFDGLMSGDTAALHIANSKENAKFNSKDYKDATTVTVKNYSLDTDSAKNYYIATASKEFTIPGSITKRPVYVTAEDKKAEYGKAFAGTFTATYTKNGDGTGFVEGESVSDIDVSGLNFACEYVNDKDSVNRHAGDYVITPSGLEAGNTDSNYRFEYVTGTLTVEKAVIKITSSGDEGSVQYGTTISNTHTLIAGSTQYETDTMGNLKGRSWSGTDGWKSLVDYRYVNTTTGVSYTQAEVKYAPEGTYKIYPVINDTKLYSDDYRFVCDEVNSSAEMRVVKPYLIVTGLTANSKVYDGTTEASVNWTSPDLKFYIDGTGSSYSSEVYVSGTRAEKNLAEMKAMLASSAISEDKILDIKSISFDEANAKAAEGVSLVVSAGALAKDRFTLIFVNDSNETTDGKYTYAPDSNMIIQAANTAPITKKPLTVKVVPDKTEAKYGELDSDSIVYTFEYTGLVSRDASLGSRRWDVNEAYTTNDNVGTYTISILENEQAATLKSTVFANYEVSFDTSDIVITQNRFAKPVVSLGSAPGTVGTVYWTHPASIGNVQVSGYELTLYKLGAGDSRTKVGSSVTVADDVSASDCFVDAIRANGEGYYEVDVVALSSNKTNVDDSEPSTSSTKVHAVKAILKAKNAASLEGLKDETEKSTLKFTNGQTINSKSVTAYETAEKESYVILLAGENAAEFTFTLRDKLNEGYSTGYSYKESACSTAGVTVDATLNTGMTKDYTGSVSVGSSVTANVVYATVELTLTEPTLKVDITYDSGREDNKIYYGYAADAVTFTATPSVVAGDNINPEDYDYTYRWYTHYNNAYPVDTGITTGTYTLPAKLAYKASGYEITCVVTATRKDNGLSTDNKSGEFPEFAKFMVEKANLTAYVSIADWTYGSKHSTPVIKIKIGDVSGDYSFGYDGKCTFISGVDLLNSTENKGLVAKLYYKKTTDAGWTLYNAANHPVDAGSYDMYVYVTGGSNFADFDGRGQKITFNVAKAKYGTATNLIMGGNSDRDHYGSISFTLPSHIYEDAETSGKRPAAFHIDLRKIVKSAGTEGKAIADAVFDELKAEKKIPAGALITDYRDIAIFENGIDISENYFRNNGTVTVNGDNSVTYVYDFGDDIVTTGIYYFTVKTYETTEDFTINSPDSLASYDTLNVYASDEASLTVDHYKNIQSKIKVTDEGTVNTNVQEYSRMYNSRPIELSLDTEDGTYTKWQWYKNGAPISGATGATLDIHYVDESAFYACHMWDANDYEYESISRKITVTPRPIAITTIGATKTYDGTALTNTDTPATHLEDKSVWYVDEVNNSSCYGVASYFDVAGNEIFDRFTSYSFANSQTAVGKISNEMSGIVIKRNDRVVYDSSWAAGKNNYVLTQTNGKLVVTNADLSNAVITITGTDTFIYDGTKHEPAITVTYTPEGKSPLPLTEGTDYTISYTNNIFSNKTGYVPTITINAVSGGNYSGSDSKTFTINKRKVMLKSENLEKEYDGTELKSASTAVLTDIVGNVAGTDYLGILNDGTHIDTISAVSYTGTITNEGTADNTFVVTRIFNEKGIDVTADYEVTPSEGTLKITKRTIEITSETKQWIYDGNVHTFKGAGNEASHVSVTAGTLATGDAIAAVTFADSAKVKEVADGMVNNTFSDVVIKKNGVDVTANYTIVTVDGKLSVSARNFATGDKPIGALEITGPSDVTYTGTAKTPDDISIFDNVGGAKRELTLGDASTGDFYISGYEYNTEVESGSEKPAVIITGRGNYAGSFKVNFNINKADQTIVADNVEVVYDGTAHSIVGAYSEGTPADGNLGTAGITYSANNTRTDVGINTVTITAAATRNYKAATTTKTLKVTPHPIETLILSDNDFTYDGAKHGPTITVKADLGGGNVVTLTEGTDFEVADDKENNITIEAKEVGTYTVKVTGKGNYEGTLTDTYVIVDREDPTVSTENGGIYCKGKTFTIEDANLVSVVITEKIIAANGTAGSENIIYNDTGITGTSAEYTVAGSQYGSIIRVVATDKSGNTNSEMIFKVFDDHLFLDGTYTYLDARELEMKAPCDHNCGTYDYIIRRWGTVTWEYEYSYSVSTSATPHHGVQGVDARATYAKVELLQNGTVIATQFVDCESTCGSDQNITSGTDTYCFDSYDPSDPTKPSGSAHIPAFDDNEEGYIYVLKFTEGDYRDGIFTPVNDYAVSYAELYEDADVPDENGVMTHITKFGYKAAYSYQPGCFDVPWEVTVKNLPIDHKGKTIMPELLYVKVLFAYGPDADDSETATGYQIISQQAHYGDLGVACEPVVIDERTVKYVGHYPVWKYQGGTTDSYYHRIQVVGHQIDGKEFDLSHLDPKLKSINDSDHVNHTIYYIPGPDAEDNGTASGTIRYELELGDLESALLIFDLNQGNDTTNVVTSLHHDIMVKDNIGDEVTAEELGANVPVRTPYYEFEGWYYEKQDGGEPVTSIPALNNLTTLYAHWRELVPPTGSITIENTVFSEFSDPDDIENMETIRRSSIVSFRGVDDGGETGVDNSGVKALYYYITDTALSIDDVKSDSISWTLLHGGIRVPSDGEYIIYLKIVDNDGNEGFVNTKRIKWIAPLVIPSPQPEPTPEPEEKPAPISPKKPVKPVNPGTPDAPVKPAEPETTPETETIENPITEERNGSLQIIVENEGEKKTQSDNASNEPHIQGELPRKEELVGILTDAEVDKLNNGSDIVIRLTVDDTKYPEEDVAMDDFIENFNKSSDEDEIAVLKTYINLTLEKSIDDSEWERIHESHEKISVVINIPEDLRKAGEKLVLVKKDGSGYIVLEDLDDNPDTITVLTDDFASQYAIISILDEETAKAYGLFGDKEIEAGDHGRCFWHWFILLTDIIFIICILLTLKKKDEEDDEEADEEEREENEEAYEKIIKRSVRRRYEATALSAILMIVWNVLGTCWIELPASIVSEIVLVLLQYLTYKRKFNTDDREEEKK